jgi:hypothetical protein
MNSTAAVRSRDKINLEEMSQQTMRPAGFQQ